LVEFGTCESHGQHAKVDALADVWWQ